MPDTSSRSTESTDLTIDLELGDQQQDPGQSALIPRVQQIALEVARRWGLPVGAGFLSSNAMYDLLVIVLQGYPNLLPQMKKILAEYQIPAVAATYATLGALDALGVEEVKESNRVALSIMDGLGATTFTLPMTMEILTRFIQLIEDEPRSSDVQIPNWSAALIITFCGLLGVIQALQSDYLKTNSAEPDREQSLINRIVTHPFMLTASAVMKSAASVHGATLAFMELAQVNTQADLEYYLRWGITLASGAVGGFILGRPNPEQRIEARIFNHALTASQLFALCLAFAGTFYLSADAEKTYGDVIEEQTILWVAIIPLLITMINLFHALWTVNPSLLHRCENTLNHYFESASVEATSDEGEELALNSEVILSYGTNVSTVSDSSDSERGTYTVDDLCSENDEYSSSNEEQSEFSDEEQEESDPEEQGDSQEKTGGKASPQNISFSRLISQHSPILRAAPPTKSGSGYESDSDSTLRIN